MLPRIQTISNNFIKPLNIQIKKSKLKLEEDNEETEKKQRINEQIQEL